MCSGLARAKTSIAHALLELGVVHGLDLGSRDRSLAVADAEHSGDGRRGDLVVAGDHRDADSAAVAFLDRFDRLLAGRIHEPDKAEQDQVLRQVFRLERASFQVRIRQPGKPQHPLALRGEPVAFAREAAAIERRRPVRGLLPVAVLEDHLGRALDEQHLAVR